MLVKKERNRLEREMGIATSLFCIVVMAIVMEADFVRVAIVGCRRLERDAAPRGGAPAGHTATPRLCPNVNT
jgi:hypothetical protein